MIEMVHDGPVTGMKRLLLENARLIQERDEALRERDQARAWACRLAEERLHLAELGVYVGNLLA